MAQTFKVQIPSKGAANRNKVAKSSDLFGGFDDFAAPKKKKSKGVEAKPAKKVTPNLPAVVPDAPMPAVRTGKLGKTDMSNLKTLFGDRAEEILGMIESNNRDGAITLLYRQLLSMTVDIIPFAENLVRSTKGYRGVYQINALVSQCRELLADIQSTQDRGALGRNMVERHVRPAFLDIAMQIVSSNHALASDILLLVPPDKKPQIQALFQANQKSLAEYIQAQYNNIRDELMRGLS